MNEEENQRGYFRIDDEVFLHVKKINPVEVADMPTYFNSFRQATLITAQFHQKRTAMAPVLREINSRDTAISNYFSMLNEQIDLLATRLLTDSIFGLNEPLQRVNISAEGMRFSTPVEFQIGDQLEIIYAQFPGGDYIPVLAEVVRCEWDNGNEEYEVAVRYVSINEDDKELVIHHILYLQRQLLHKKRLAG